MKNEKLDLPEDLFDFAFIPKFWEVIDALAVFAEPEDWTYQNSQSPSAYPILENYIKYTYKRLAEEKKFSYSRDGNFCCFNTGLVTKNQEPILMGFSQNMLDGPSQYWHFWKFLRGGEYDISRFNRLPEMAYYFDDPAKIVFDTRKELVTNIEHIIEDNKFRFSPPFNTMQNYQLRNSIEGAIKSAIERIKRNYKTAIPQYYRNNIQLLIPLCLSDPQIADLALVVEDYGTMYRASTCLTLDMAINNARQLAKPDRDWLQP